MAQAYITIGCPTTGGGKVLTGNSNFLIEGIPVACVGDKASCPKHKVVATIITGDPYMNIFGKSAARVNDSLSCGCKLLQKQQLVVGDNGGGSGSSSNSPVQAIASTLVPDNSGKFTAKFKLQTDDGVVLNNMPYIAVSNGKTIFKGVTNDQGYTDEIKTEKSEQINIQIDIDQL